MVTMQQIQQGALRFLMEDFSPNCADVGSRVAIGGTAALAVSALPKMADIYKDRLELMNVRQGALYDIDAAYNAYVPFLAGDKLPLTLPIVGRIQLSKEDFDKLLKHIKEA
jgi:hypothetical protein